MTTATPQHADREHATWSASASKRNFACPGALALIERLPYEDKSSKAADWGTCAHQIAEAVLTSKRISAGDFIGETVKGKAHSFEVDDEMADTAEMFIDYVRQKQRAAGNSGRWWVEERFSLASLGGPIDAGGTADAIIWNEATRDLEVVDLKGGRGVVVEAKGNPQLRTYALGALLATGIYPATVTVTIVQPRAAHKDGRIRSETVGAEVVAGFTSDLLAAMQRAQQARADFDKAPLDEWAAAHLSAGNHCRDTFCPAAGACPALRAQAVADAGLYFTVPEGKPVVGPADGGTPEERAQRLDALDLVDGWVAAVRAHEHRMAESGRPAPGWQLVETTGREKWIAGQETAAAEAAQKAGAAKDAVFNPARLRTPKQVREAVQKAKGDPGVLAGFSTTPKTGTNLVRADKTERPPVDPAATYFTVPTKG